jgi:hypothetical protein
MTQLAQTQTTRTQPRTLTGKVAGIALAAAVLGGIVVGGIQALSHGTPANAPSISAHDLAVLKSAQEWEARYKQMYPGSL